MTPADLQARFREAVAGTFPADDGTVELVAESVGQAHAVVAFSAHFVVCAPVTRDWLDVVVPPDDFAATHHPDFLRALADRVGADIGALDVVLASDQPALGPHDDLGLVEVDDRDHPRVRRSLRYRDDVRVWRTPDGGGHLVVGRGLVGRREAAFEVAPTARGRGLGLALAQAARVDATPEDPVFVQVSPGNVASLRATLAAGYRPMCSEVLLPPRVPGGAPT